MCGLVGMAGNLIAVHDKVMRTLLMLDAVRGEDSTGIAAVNKWSNEVRVAKHLGDPFQLFQTKAYENIMSKTNKVFIGHNRYATSGGVNRHSAHPFEFDTLVGVHNGTLSSKGKLLDADHFRVDSENLYHHIEQRGLDDALKQLGGYGNAWALVWWNKEESTLNFLRNEERPLWVCRTEDHSAMFWASESWMLSVALSRNAIKYEPLFQLEENLLHTIHIDNNGKMSKPLVRKAEAPKPVVPPKATGTAPSNNNTALAVVGGTESKKPDTTSSTGCDKSYLCAKDVVFEVMAKHTDSNGSVFFALFDDKHPYEEVRLYARKTDFFDDLIDKKVTGDISGWLSYHNTPGKGYYKVTPWTIKEVEEKKTTQHDLFPSHKGSFLTKQQWEKQYSDCAWCTSPLMAEDDNIFTTEGQCLCPSCAADDTITQNVKISSRLH